MECSRAFIDHVFNGGAMPGMCRECADIRECEEDAQPAGQCERCGGSGLIGSIERREKPLTVKHPKTGEARTIPAGAIGFVDRKCPDCAEAA